MLTEVTNVYRRLAPHLRRVEPLPAVFVLEPTMYLASAVVASWDPASMMQVVGGVSCPARESVRETIGWAIAAQRVGTVVLCGEGDTPPGPDASPLAACRALVEDRVLGKLIEEQGVTLEALWFDRHEGDIHRWDREARRWTWLSDLTLTAFFAELRSRTAGARYPEE